MSEINFFMTDDESLSLFKFFLEEYDAGFVPENNPSPEAPVLRSLEAIQSDRGTCEYAERYFVVSDCWTRYPLHLRELDSQGHHYHYVVLRCGGPAFDLSPARSFVEHDTEWIVPGELSDYPWYNLDESCEETFSRPEEMKAAYARLSRFIRKGACASVCQEKGFRGPYITPGARAAFERGVRLRVGDFHFAPVDRKRGS